MSPTAVVISGFHWLSTSPEKMTAINGTMSHHTTNEPKQTMSAYLKPMM